MGNFHCIPSSCARVVWREYLPAYVDIVWATETDRIYGNQLLVDKQRTLRPNQNSRCCVEIYDVKITFVKKRVNSNTPVYVTFTNNNFLGKLDRSFGNNGFLVQDIGGVNRVSFRGLNCDDTVRLQYDFSAGFNYDFTGEYTIEKFNFVRLYDVCKYDCTVTVTGVDNEGNDFEWTKTKPEDCPEITEVSCRLSEQVKEIKIEKEAHLQRIEIRNQTIDTIYISPLEAPLLDVNRLPTECLNIYNTYVLAPPILSNYVPLPGAINPYQFIQQICSAPGCPPPEYEVICDCDCESCPDGTCAAKCGDHICCYDTSTGIAVQQIELDNYCEDEN